MRYCGIVAGPQHTLCVVEEVVPEEPPVRLEAAFYEPGSVTEVAAAVDALEDAVVAAATPLSPSAAGRERRLCDETLRGLGIPPQPPLPEGARLAEALRGLGLYAPAQEEGTQGLVEEGAFRSARLIETNTEGIFAALQERRLPARRHPLGIQRRIEELLDDQVVDPGGDLWHRRIEEIDAAAAAVCAHRYAVGHARWIGDPAEGVVVLPGSHALERFTTEGVLPEVVRLPLA